MAGFLVGNYEEITSTIFPYLHCKCKYRILYPIWIMQSLILSIIDGRTALYLPMATTNQPTVLLSTDVTAEMMAVLKAASMDQGLTSSERQRAAAYSELLGKTIAAKEGKARTRLSIAMVANVLRIILMVIKPDPLVKALIEFIGHTL